MRLRKHHGTRVHLQLKPTRGLGYESSQKYLHSNAGLGIGAVLSAARMGRVSHRKEDVPRYLYIPADDHRDFELHQFFNQTFEFIEMARKSTNVLVHCMVGVSRSVTIVAAYLIKKYKYSLRDVFNTIQRKRTKVKYHPS